MAILFIIFDVWMSEDLCMTLGDMKWHNITRSRMHGYFMKVDCWRMSDINLTDKYVRFHDAVRSMILLTFDIICRKRCVCERCFEVHSISSWSTMLFDDIFQILDFWILENALTTFECTTFHFITWTVTFMEMHWRYMCNFWWRLCQDMQKRYMKLSICMGNVYKWLFWLSIPFIGVSSALWEAICLWKQHLRCDHLFLIPTFHIFTMWMTFTDNGMRFDSTFDGDDANDMCSGEKNILIYTKNVYHL